MTAAVIIKVDPVADDARGVLDALEAMTVVHRSLRVLMTLSTMPFCCEQCGVMNP